MATSPESARSLNPHDIVTGESISSDVFVMDVDSEDACWADAATDSSS